MSNEKKENSEEKFPKEENMNAKAEEEDNSQIAKEVLEEKKNSSNEKKDEPSKKHNKGEGSFTPVVLIMVLALVIAGLWDQIPAIKNSISFVLNPTAGALLNWNLNWGMLILVLIISIITTFVQKYATDQDTLKELKKEQKDIQKQMKEFKNHPEKMMELQKKQFAMFPKQMKLSMRGAVYTIIPFALFFRWFQSFFMEMGDPSFWLGLSWFWFYLIGAIVISSILRKKFDVV